MKEGNHGAPYIEKIRRLFGNVRFIVVQRDPRDIFVSLKTIAEQKRQGDGVARVELALVRDPIVVEQGV